MTVLHSIAQHSTAQHSTAPYGTAPCSATQYTTAQRRFNRPREASRSVPESNSEQGPGTLKHSWQRGQPHFCCVSLTHVADGSAGQFHTLNLRCGGVHTASRLQSPVLKALDPMNRTPIRVGVALRSAVRGIPGFAASP